jgi:hypothetical protein
MTRAAVGKRTPALEWLNRVNTLRALLEHGVPPRTAVVQAGWSSPAAAMAWFYRHGEPELGRIMSKAIYTPRERCGPGRAAVLAASRIERLEMRLAEGSPIERAVLEAGWPSLQEAVKILHREKHPAFPAAKAAYAPQLRAYQEAWRAARGRHAREAGRVTRDEAYAIRVEEFDFLVSCGESAARAATHAGWPSLDAAARALHRAGHPFANEAQAFAMSRRRTEGNSAHRPPTCEDTSR